MQEKSFDENKIAFWWLILSILSIAISGVFSIFLVFLRTPGLVGLFSKNIFSYSLIVHVTLSITVWMLTIQCLLSSLTFTGLRKRYSSWILILAYLGTLLIGFSPLFGGRPILNNYVPILSNLVFVFGIALFICSVLISSIFAIIEYFLDANKKENSHIKSLSFTSSVIFIIALGCFYLSAGQAKYSGLNQDIEHYYEIIFWGFGHILQYLFIQILLFSWYVMISSIYGHSILSISSYRKILYVNLLVSIICPLFYLFSTVESGAYIEFFTLHMKYFGGISSIILALLIVIKLFKDEVFVRDYRFYSFIYSLFVFGIGGMIGYLIHGANVTVPAHYHGSIVGITIALMGLVYYIISSFGYKFNSSKLLNIQLLLYCLGQTLHISGLALSGGYGALRKTPGVDLAGEAKLYLGLMGTGGLIAIISGVIFVFNCYFAIRNGKIDESR